MLRLFNMIISDICATSQMFSQFSQNVLRSVDRAPPRPSLSSPRPTRPQPSDDDDGEKPVNRFGVEKKNGGAALHQH